MDKKGFLWCITEFGLNRFDGVKFTNYLHQTENTNSLLKNNIQDITIDDKECLWLSFKNGLQVYNIEKDSFYTLKNNKENIPIHKLIYNKANRTIVGVNWDGYFVINTTNYNIKFYAYQNAEKRRSESINQLLIDTKQRLWIPLSRYGYYCINLYNNNQYYYNVDFWPLGFTETIDGEIYCNPWQEDLRLVEIKANNTHQHIAYAYPSLDYRKNIFYNATQHEALFGKNILVIANGNDGLLFFDLVTKKYLHSMKIDHSIKNGLAVNDINYLYKDRLNNFWICTWDGILKVGIHEQQFKSQEPEIFKTRLYNLISGFADHKTDKNILWASTGGAGIWKIDKQRKKVVAKYFEEFDLDSEDKNYMKRWTDNMLVDSQQNIWCGTYGGIVYIKDDMPKYIDLQYKGEWAFVKDIIDLNKNEIIAFAAIGIFKINKKTLAYKKYSLDNNELNNFRCGVVINNNQILAGGTKGYALLDLKKDKLIKYNVFSQSDTSKNLICLSMEHSNGIIYLGTKKGIYKYNWISKKLHKINLKENEDVIDQNNLLLDDSNNLWIYTNHALYKYNNTTEKLYSFTQKDGILYFRNDPCKLFRYENKFYLGFRGAFTFFDPLKTNTSIPLANTYLDNVYVKNKKVSKKTTKFRHNQNEFVFEITSPLYAFANNINYKIKLNGLNENWVNIGNKRQAAYNNLKPGHYSLEVQATNSEGKFSKPELIYQFEIVPAFYQTKFFYFIILTILFALAYTLYKWRINNIHKINEERQKAQQLQIKEYEKQIELEQIANFFSLELVNKNNVEEILWTVSKNLIGKLGFEDCMIYLWNDYKTVLIQIAGYGQKGSMEKQIEKEKYNIPKGVGIVGAAAESNKVILINDTSKDKRYKFVDGILRKSELAVPIFNDGMQWGVINAESSKKDFFNKWHIQILNTIAALIALKLKAIKDEVAIQKSKFELLNAKAQIAETELAMLRTQMNPHFIFNSLHSINNFIWDNKIEDASSYLIKFSKLIRRILELSNKKLVTLEEEIETIKLYIELEHRRTKAKFNYSVHVDEKLDIDKLLIPSLISQPFVENSIWHGINHLEDRIGILNLSFTKQAEYLEITIEDNGVGRTKSKAINASRTKQSMGINITTQRLESYRIENKKALEIIDKQDGTTVKIILPLQYAKV